MATSPTTIDIDSPVFAMRFANLLRATRLERGTTFRTLVKASGQEWTKAHLKQIEDGLLTLDEHTVESVSMAYGADLDAILPSRLPVVVADDGVISAGGVKAVFVPRNETSLLTAYLRLIRTMRRQRKAPMITLRREDIEVLAAHLAVPGESVVDRLTALMGATLQQRTAIASMFAAGAVVIGLAGATVAGPPERILDVVTERDQRSVAAVTATTEVPAAVDATVVTMIDAAATVTSSTETIAPAVAAAPTSTIVAAPAAAVVPVGGNTSTGTDAVVLADPAPPTTADAADTPLDTAPAEEPIVATGLPPVPLDPTTVVATGLPPVPTDPTTVVGTGELPDPGSAEPPLVPDGQPAPVADVVVGAVVDGGAPPVPTSG